MSVTMMLMIRMSLRIQASCSVHCRLVEEGDVYDGHTCINTCPLF